MKVLKFYHDYIHELLFMIFAKLLIAVINDNNFYDTN